METASKLTVLVVEDNPINLRLMELQLTNLGVQSVLVDNGRKAIEAAKSDGYDMILMDIMMPEVDGFQAAYEIRKLEWTLERHTPIIACTALGKSMLVEQCIRCGIDDYLEKPISQEQLQTKIRRWTQMVTVAQPFSATTDMPVNRFSMEGQNSVGPIDRAKLSALYGPGQLDNILSLFMTVTEMLLEQLESALARHDVIMVRRMVHEIKSSSLAVNAREMSKVCLQFEMAGEQNNWTTADKLYNTLGLAFARVREYLLVKSLNA